MAAARKSLTVTVISAANLPRVEVERGCDAMAKVIFKKNQFTTKVIHDLNPLWDQKFEFKLKKKPEPNAVVKIEVYDYETWPLPDRLLGVTEVSFSNIYAARGPYNVTRNLEKKKKSINSTITLEFMYTDPLAAVSEDIDSGERESSYYPLTELTEESEASESEDVVTAGVKETGTSKGHESDYADMTTADEDESFQLKPGAKRLKKRKAPTGDRTQDARSKLPKKLTNFQIRVHIIEGRQLQSGHMNPMVKVLCGDQSDRSQVTKGTNNPFFDKLMFFNFLEYPNELFDKTLDIRVLNSKIDHLYSQMIGSFKLDLGMIYDEPDHCFIHKWLLLTDPEDPSFGIKGYLKFSVHVLSPGVPLKHYPTLTNEAIDIESNLLQPTGVEVSSMTLQVRVYRANDLPQMDPEYYEEVKVKLKNLLHKHAKKKDLVDPYCTVKFAGYHERTRTIKHNDDPVWNQQININFRFPSMSERIRIRLKDYDKGSKDDIIGTTFIRLPEISSPGVTDAGYLPTFGPCFINVYGSPREFSVAPDKYDHLNKGVFSGVAYRGRVMVEIGTIADQMTTTGLEDIRGVEIGPFLRQKNYRLFGTFYSATMVSPADSTIEFEVSIGNYGNILDKDSVIQMSTTPPTNPVFDGNHYYYLPWYNYKPCILIDSQWEDNTYRIETQNLLLSIADNLGAKLEEVNSLIEEGMDDDDYSLEKEIEEKCLGVLLKVLQELLENISKPFPGTDKTVYTEAFTELDKLKYNARVDALRSMKELIQHGMTPRDDSLLKLESVLELAESVHGELLRLSAEPQNSVPDVIIWMLAGEKRVACYRIPSNELMFSDKSSAYCGSKCNKILNIHLKPPAVTKEEELENIEPAGALLRVKFWLGLEGKWSNEQSKDLAMFAETYQNQAAYLGGWNEIFLQRPAWSDAAGKMALNPEFFKFPDHSSWEWEEDWLGYWKIESQLDAAYQTERGLAKFVEVLFEYQQRVPFVQWPEDESKSYWKDKHNQQLVLHVGNQQVLLTKNTFGEPEGWEWVTDWQIDIHRACDENGWEYCFEPALGKWHPQPKNYYIIRRRKWLRTRMEKEGYTQQVIALEDESDDSKAGWEYARFHTSPYQKTYHRTYLARRRKYIRKIKTSGKHLKNPPRFYFPKDSDKQQVPRLFLPLPNTPYKYQLRVHLYQARNLFAGDSSGLSDPFCLVSFGRNSQRTRTIEKTLNPLWNHACIFDNVRIFGEPRDIKESVPTVIVELFDEDTSGKDYLGVVRCAPIVRIGDTPVQPLFDDTDSDGDLSSTEITRLKWHKVMRYGHHIGDLLAAFELFLIDSVKVPELPEKVFAITKDGKEDHRKWWYSIPKDIQPHFVKTRIEILCWGMRDLKKYRLGSVISPFVKVECGDQVHTTTCIANTRRNPNFTDPVIVMIVDLPTERMYSPPFNIHVYDKRAFGQRPLIGTHVIRSITVEAPTKKAECVPINQVTLRKTKKSKKTVIMMESERITFLQADPDYWTDSKYDWWSKYKVSEDHRIQNDYTYENHDRLTIYENELEKNFDHFYDVVRTFQIYRGKGSEETDNNSDRYAGKFKGCIRATRCEDYDRAEPLIQHLPTKDLCDVIVRVYLIEGKDLVPKDPNGKSDPYVKLRIGKYKHNDVDHHLKNTLNPVFGRMIELPATLPLDHTLKIQVFDHDFGLNPDDFIGETEIDIENRFISRYRATCGLPASFSKNGPNRWRDDELPRNILNWYCKVYGFDKPIWIDDDPPYYSVIFKGNSYTLEDDDLQPYLSDHKYLGSEDQQLALALLLKERVLVPEHVETRTLYNPAQPKIPQGLLRMWVDIFPKSHELPPAVDISPRKPKDYVLRVIVYNVKDVDLADFNFMTGEEMSDIYVKGWLRGQEDTQKTDVHYRSFDGEGNFNWRFVFPFKYFPTEQEILVSKKEHFYSFSKTETRVHPFVTVQVWDNDKFKIDDHLGTLEFDLTAIHSGAKTSMFLDKVMDDDEQETEDLFEKKRIRRWWALNNDKGKIELELEILTLEEAELKPAGKARDDPNMNPYLPPPNRPETSFFWLTSPLKTFRFIIWRYYKWHIIIGIIIIMLVLLLVIFIYTTPEFLAKYFLDRLLPF